MSGIGYHRIKILPSKETSTIEIYQNGSQLVQHTIKARPWCAQKKYIKFLDRNGFYRFFTFNENWNSSDSIGNIDEIEKEVTNIYTDQGATYTAGIESSRTIEMNADFVTDDELDKLSDAFTSPRVYLYIGDGTSDLKQDWLIVKIQGDGINRRTRRKHSPVAVTVTLPRCHNITMK